MNPTQQQLDELTKRLDAIERWMKSFDNAAQVDPITAKTLREVVGVVSLDSLSDVTLSSPSAGEVLKYNGTVWENGTDNVGP